MNTIKRIMLMVLCIVLLVTLCNISCLSEESLKQEKQTSNTEIIAAVLGAALGALGTFLLELWFRRRDQKKVSRHSASILYFDLASIESFISDYSKNKTCTDIRYIEEWADLVLTCSYLNADEIKLIFRVYDLVYDYNFYHNQPADPVTMGVMSGSLAKKTFDELEKVIKDKTDNGENVIVNTWAHLKDHLIKIGHINVLGS